MNLRVLLPRLRMTPLREGLGCSRVSSFCAHRQLLALWRHLAQLTMSCFSAGTMGGLGRVQFQGAPFTETAVRVVPHGSVRRSRPLPRYILSPDAGPSSRTSESAFFLCVFVLPSTSGPGCDSLLGLQNLPAGATSPPQQHPEGDPSLSVPLSNHRTRYVLNQVTHQLPTLCAFCLVR